MAAPLVNVVVQIVVRTEDGGEATCCTVQVPGALPHVREQDLPILGVLGTLLLQQVVVVDAGAVLRIW